MTRKPAHAGKGRASGTDPMGEKHHAGLKERAVHEFRQFVIMFLYLFVMFGLLRIHESIILEQHSIDLTGYGFALVNALILAKVMLVADGFHLGRNFEDKPLIYPILFKSLLFAIVFMCFHVVEDTLIGMWHGKTLLESVPGFGGGGFKGVVSVGVLESFALVPFFAFTEMSRAFGAGALQTILFKRGPKEVIVEFKPRPAAE